MILCATKCVSQKGVVDPVTILVILWLVTAAISSECITFDDTLIHGLLLQSSAWTDNKFDAKTDKGSAELYFHYYGMLMHQQNMLQVRLLS